MGTTINIVTRIHNNNDEISFDGLSIYNDKGDEELQVALFERIGKILSNDDTKGNKRARILDNALHLGIESSTAPAIVPFHREKHINTIATYHTDEHDMRFDIVVIDLVNNHVVLVEPMHYETTACGALSQDGIDTVMAALSHNLLSA